MINFLKNPIKWWKDRQAVKRHKKKMEEKLKKLRDQDPFIYE